MRVIAGKLGSRNFKSPKGFKTHPMSDKMRGGLFASLGDIEGLNVLDAFSGSGALSIEAISRGASSSIAIDSDKSAYKVIKDNLKDLNLENSVKAINARFRSWSDNNQDKLFDLVLADPPYDNLPNSDIKSLSLHLKPQGTLVLSWPPKIETPSLNGLKAIKENNYGDSKLVFYQHIS